MRIADLDHPPPAAQAADAVVAAAGQVVPEDGDSTTLAATKPPTPPPPGPPAVSMRQLFRFATWFDVLLISIGSLCAVANGGSMAAFSVILGSIFDSLNSTDPGAATSVSLLFVYLACGLFVTGTLQVACFTSASERMTIALRREYLAAVLRQDIAFFDDAQLSGSLASQVSENALLVREAYGEKLGQLVQNLALFLGGLAVGFAYSWQLSLTVLSMGPFLIVSGYFMAKALGDLVGGQLDSYAKAGQIAEETLTLIRTVTSLGLQDKQIALYNKELTKSAVKQTEQGRSMGLGLGATMFIMFASYALALFVGAVLVRNSKNDLEREFPLSAAPINSNLTSFCAVGGDVPLLCGGGGTRFFETAADVCACAYCQCGCFGGGATQSRCLSGGDIILCFFSVLMGSFAIGQAAPSLSALANGRVAAAALHRVINRKPAIVLDNNTIEEEEPLHQTTPTSTSSKGSEIEFRDVHFCYPTRREAPIFTGLNLVIPAGKRVALVGESGSGKSTCIGLIERYYDPDAGQVLLDGADIKHMNVKLLRQRIGLVSQEPILFATSVLENVRYGRPSATDDEVIEACKQANAHGFITAFPDQYGTFVSSSVVSGGQKQRIAIARALLRNPPILLLDEATAALDNESERLVNEAIERLLSSGGGGGGSRTTIVIAHRLSSIKACDVIFVMERGKVKEQGSHDELVSKVDGLYASLVKLSEGSGRVGGAGAGSEATQTAEDDNAVVAEDAVDPFLNAVAAAAVAAPDVVPQDPAAMDTSAAPAATAAPRKKYPMRWAFRYAYPERWYFVPALLSAIGNGLTFPIFALVFAQLIETFFFPNNSEIESTSATWSLAFLGLAVGNALCTFVQHLSFGYINGRMTMRVRSALFAHTLTMEMAFFDDKENNIGALTSKLSSDAAMVRAAICDRIALLVSNLATVAAGFTIAFVASWQVSLVVFALFPALMLGGALEMKLMSGMATQDQSALEQAAQTLSESINGIRTVTAFNMQRSVQRLYFSQLQGPMRAAQRKGLGAGLGFGFSQATMFMAYAVCFYYGSTLVADGTISFKDLNMALFGTLFTAISLGQALAMIPDAAKGQAAVNSVFSTLARKSHISNENNFEKEPGVVLGDVEFRNVSFAYPSRPDVPVLKDFSLKVRRGQTVAFVGTSGSGKSTLVLLLERFYDPSSGTVLVDDRDVRELNPQWLRHQIGIVSQEPALFRGSILENIRNGNVDATDEECYDAAKQANAHGFIAAFPDQYLTDLHTAQGVSGGQKQRIAIARALVRRPQILLLDEATSALDEESQRVVQDALDALLQKQRRTTFIVAHRLSTIRNADVIVVLQSGVVVEQGSFEELSSKPNGAFQSLLRAQAGGGDDGK